MSANRPVINPSPDFIIGKYSKIIMIQGEEHESKKRKIEKLIPIIKEKIKEISFFEEYQNDEAILKQIIDLCELKTFRKARLLLKKEILEMNFYNH